MDGAIASDLTATTTGLECRGLRKSFGPIEVLKSIDLALRPGTVLGLIGENGAGKSTFNAIIAGVVAPSSGEMRLDGQPYVPHSPSDAIAHGVALIHQEIRLLPDLSVAENLFLGRLPMRAGRVDRARMEDEANAVLAALGVLIDPRREVKGLTVATQQGIEIAKAILRKPRYVIFDEPTAALGETEAKQIFEQVHRLRDGGTGIIYVSHRLDEIQSLADEVACFRDGHLVERWDQMPVAKQDMINAMVGARVHVRAPRPPAAGRSHCAARRERQPPGRVPGHLLRGKGGRNPGLRRAHRRASHRRRPRDRRRRPRSIPARSASATGPCGSRRRRTR